MWSLAGHEPDRFFIFFWRGSKEPRIYFVEKSGLTSILPPTFDELEAKGPFLLADSQGDGLAEALSDTVRFPVGSTMPYKELVTTKSGASLISQDWNGKVGSVPGLKHLPYKRLNGPTVWSSLLKDL